MGAVRLTPVNIERTGNTIKICFTHPNEGRSMCRIIRLPVDRVRPQIGDHFVLPDGTEVVLDSVESATGTPDFDIE